MEKVIESVSGILDGLSDAQKNYLIILNDPITRRIMAKLASSQSPIITNDIPLNKLGVEKETSVLSRLSFLEKSGYVEFSIEPSKSKFAKKYILNDKGTNLVNTKLKRESKLFEQ